MERLYDLWLYFPRHIANESLQNYVNHHIGSVQKCAENALFSSAYSHLHLIYMAFVYNQILRISKTREREFELCWIGFPSQEKEFLKDPDSAFSFSKLNEKSVFRFFRLIGFDDSDVGQISSLVTNRNNRLHASGQLYCEDEGAFIKEIDQYMNRMEQIVGKENLFLSELYEELLKTYDDDFEFTDDEIQSNFEDQYNFSEVELRNLSQGKTDSASKYIREAYL